MTEPQTLKHVGRLKNTGDRVVVVFRELVDENGTFDSDHALVLYPDRLQDRYHDRIMDLLESDRAQDSNDFYEVLNSKTFHDGNNMLTFLHQRGHLKRVPVDNVTLCPTPQDRFPLREHNQSLRGEVPTPEQNSAPAANQQAPAQPQSATPQSAEQEDNTPEGQAQALLAQAHIMEQERDMMNRTIQEKRDEAYRLDPSLKPEEKPIRSDEDNEEG